MCWTLLARLPRRTLAPSFPKNALAHAGGGRTKACYGIYGLIDGEMKPRHGEVAMTALVASFYKVSHKPGVGDIVKQQRVRSDFEITPQQIFLPTVHREIRRTERSGRPFLLALIRSEALGGQDGLRLARQLAAILQTAIRETDWLGWYEDNRTLGIVLTELGEADEAQIKVLTCRISMALEKTVTADVFHKFKLIVRQFPRHSTWREADGWDEQTYRDLDVTSGPRARQLAVKRAVDVAGSLFGILTFLPLFAAIAILSKLTSRGPVFYRQKRVGQYGRVFEFYKFRSMLENNDPEVHREYMAQMIKGCREVQHSNGIYKLVDDSRVTKLGRFLRRTSLDELPQFLNVLRGDMSLVGPRPPLPYEFERYQVWHRRRVMDIKPGLTGLWQVKGRSRTTFDDMVRMDLCYANNWSIWMDIRIIFQTPAAMLSGVGAF